MTIYFQMCEKLSLKLKSSQMLVLAGLCSFIGAAMLVNADTSSSYANEPSMSGDMLLTSLAMSEPISNSSQAYGHISPLLAKEIAVLTNRGVSFARAVQAIEVQSRVADAELMRRLQAAMGSDYAGMWFENVAAQLHVGVTTHANQRIVERVVTEADLVADVTITPVRSSMAKLLTVQNEWNQKLATYIRLGAVTTGLEPQLNAVSITLSLSVPAEERAILKREAGAADVNVVVTTVALDKGERPEAKECNNFPPANCNPSITAGVTIERPAEDTGKGKGKSHRNTTLDGFLEATLAGVLPGDEVTGPGIPEETYVNALPTKTSVTISKAATTEEEAEFTFKTGASCTAGPQAIPKNNKLERVLLTAGHCIEFGHGVGAKWYAYKRNLEKPLIGGAEAYKFGGAAGAKVGDYGDIKIEPGPGGAWQTGVANDPVLAVTARWEKAEETRYSVKGENVPAVGNMNCHEGQTSGGKCGEVKKLNVPYAFNGKTVEGLVEVETESAGGDSGGDYFFINMANELLATGTHVSKSVAGKPIYEPLTQPEAGAAPGSLSSLNLELLTEANEIIPPCAP